ncbi:peptidase inhibitor family I36 protein [Streptomyces sp. NPDC050704]|uniref:peptidase inhibitor family I36 protein n=1 Tax=Streptomyces sp. NPDC050704 TaxID=3157219 RepID=UPI0034317F1D
MLRNKIATALTAVGLTALSLTAVPGAAQASESAPPSTRAAAADGYLHVYMHQNYGTPHCQWSGDSDNWDSCNGMRNEASSLWNNGFTHDVWLYYGPNQTGASFCLDKGEKLPNIVHYHFPNNGTGGGTSLNDNIASHEWVANC